MGCTLATGSGKDKVREIRQVAIDFQSVHHPFLSCGLDLACDPIHLQMSHQILRWVIFVGGLMAAPHMLKMSFLRFAVRSNKTFSVYGVLPSIHQQKGGCEWKVALNPIYRYILLL